LEGQLESLREQVNAVDEQRAGQEAQEVANATQKVAELEKEVVTLREQLDAATLASAESLPAELPSTADTSAELEALQAELVASQKALAQRTSQVTMVKEHYDKAREHIKKLSTALQAAKRSSGGSSAGGGALGDVLANHRKVAKEDAARWQKIELSVSKGVQSLLALSQSNPSYSQAITPLLGQMKEILDTGRLIVEHSTSVADAGDQ
jgi:chromosome segregation ATPase